MKKPMQMPFKVLVSGGQFSRYASVLVPFVAAIFKISGFKDHTAIPIKHTTYSPLPKLKVKSIFEVLVEFRSGGSGVCMFVCD